MNGLGEGSEEELQVAAVREVEVSRGEGLFAEALDDEFLGAIVEDGASGMCLYDVEGVVEEAVVDKERDELGLFEMFLLALHAPYPGEEVEGAVDGNGDVYVVSAVVAGEVFGLCLLKEGEDFEEVLF